jgi:hypothetical protein
METASFTGLIKTICYILLFYFAFKIAVRLLLPFLINKAAQKAQETLRRQAQEMHRRHTHQQTPHKAEPVKKANTSKAVGEYIDFEEIE